MVSDTLTKKSVRAKENISQGVGLIGKLVSAASVLNLLSHAITIPRSQWLESALNAYAAVFHPIVDATVGLVPWLFGYSLLPVTKDVIVIYGLFAGAFFRLMTKPPDEQQTDDNASDSETETKKEPIINAVGAAVIWPFVIAWMFFIQWALSRAHEEYGDPLLFRLSLIFGLLEEMLYVFAIVIVAIVFNAAGIL